MDDDALPVIAAIHATTLERWGRLVILAPTPLLRDLLGHIGTELRLRGQADSANYCAKAAAVLEP